MDEATRRALRDLNRRFYDRFAADFSRRRERPWPGWERVVGRLPPPGPQRVLDAGCGNGRFGSFLAGGRRPGSVRYLGLDGCARLLRIAADRLADLTPDLRRVDLLDAELETVAGDERFDLVVLFGVLHHLPGHDVRRNLLCRLAAFLAPGGVLAASVWRLDRDPRFDRLRVPWESFRGEAPAVSQLEPGDVLLSFDGDVEHPRYCHFPADAEIDAWIEALEPPLIDRFEADGPSGRENLYLLFRCANLAA